MPQVAARKRKTRLRKGRKIVELELEGSHVWERDTGTLGHSLDDNAQANARFRTLLRKWRDKGFAVISDVMPSPPPRRRPQRSPAANARERIRLRRGRTVRELGLAGNEVWDRETTGTTFSEVSYTLADNAKAKARLRTLLRRYLRDRFVVINDSVPRPRRRP